MPDEPAQREHATVQRIPAAGRRRGHDLGALHGPLHGQHQLPLHLDSSARAVYDFGSRPDREHAYQLVLLEASCTADLEQWLQEQELLHLWPVLYLPRVVRAAWQQRHATLNRIGAGPHVPQL